MVETQKLTTTSNIDLAIADVPNIDSIPDARKKLTIAYHATKALNDEYQAAKLSEALEDKIKILEAAYKLSAYKLLVESQLGRLIQKEQDAGRLATQGHNQYSSGSRSRTTTSIKTLADYGLTKDDSSNAKKLLKNENKIIEALHEKPQDEPLTRKQFLDTIKDEKKAADKDKHDQEIKAGIKDIPISDKQNIISGDISLLNDELENNSVDMFFTDPPYDKESIPLFNTLAELAQKKLKPGGLCLTYCGHVFLPEIIKLMSNHLDYYWTFAIILGGDELRIWSRKIWTKWKPILVYIKKPTSERLTSSWCTDYIRGDGEDKKYHKWGQNIQEATYWIETLTLPGALIVDPFCGGGTIPLACKLTNRKWISTEIDSITANIARKRLLEVNDDKTNNS